MSKLVAFVIVKLLQEIPKITFSNWTAVVLPVEVLYPDQNFIRCAVEVTQFELIAILHTPVV
jgi:uncharacterized membrane protein